MNQATNISNNILIFQREEIGKVRTAQEDCHFNDKTPNGYLFVVCDGMGGHVGGAEASSTAVKSIFEFFNKEKYDNIPQALNNALQFANAQILGKVSEYPALKGMGTTACILLLQDSKVYIAHVGDSRMYLFLGKEKELIRITKDHSYVQKLVDTGEISDDEAEQHPDKNRILKALGIKHELEPAICEKPILPKNNDMFLICSDGLNGMLPDSKIKQVLSFKNNTIEQKGNMLVNLALEAGGLDNITLQLIQISDSPHKKTVYEHCNFNPKNNKKSSGRKSKKLAKIFIILSIVLAGTIGAGIACYFIDKNSKEKKIEQLRNNIKNAKEEYARLAIEVQKKEKEYKDAKESTARAKKTLDDGSNDKTEQAYKDRKKIEEGVEKELDGFKYEQEKAENNWKNLTQSFSIDSLKIVKSKLLIK